MKQFALTYIPTDLHDTIKLPNWKHPITLNPTILSLRMAQYTTHNDLSPEARTASRDEDERWMLEIQAQQPEALEKLYDKYAPVIKSLAHRIVNNETEAEDLVQEIYMEIWNQSGSYAPEKGKPLGWILTLARRRSIDRLRKRQAYQRAEDRLQLETEQQPDAWIFQSTDSDLEKSDLRHILRNTMETLPDAQKMAVELAYYKGMSQREIAAKTGIPLGTIKTRLELGLRKIAEALKGVRDEF